MNRLEYCASFGYYLPIRQNRWLRLPSDSRQTLYTSHIKYPCLSVCLHACQSITPKRKVRDPRPIYISESGSREDSHRHIIFKEKRRNHNPNPPHRCERARARRPAGSRWRTCD